jgi:hypothetical protein
VVKKISDVIDSIVDHGWAFKTNTPSND